MGSDGSNVQTPMKLDTKFYHTQLSDDEISMMVSIHLRVVDGLSRPPIRESRMEERLRCQCQCDTRMTRTVLSRVTIPQQPTPRRFHFQMAKRGGKRYEQVGKVGDLHITPNQEDRGSREDDRIRQRGIIG